MEICFVTPRFPYPATRGDQVRTYNQIKQLSRRHAVTLVTAHDGNLREAEYAEMRRWCKRIELVPMTGWLQVANAALRAPHTKLPLQVMFYESTVFRKKFLDVLASQKFDVVHASLIRTAPYVWDVEPPVVIDVVDALSRSITNRASLVSFPLRYLYEFEGRRVARYEQEVCAHFPRLVVSAYADGEALGAKNVEVIRNAVDVEKFSFSLEGRNENLIIMTGNMGYQPNVDAAVWFVTNVWGEIRKAVPSARLQFVGARPASAVRALTASPGVEVVGQVPDMSEYLRRATAAVCPMRCGSGIQNKLLEAMASGVPTVATPQGNEGVGALAGEELLVAESERDFAQATIALLKDPELRKKIALAAHQRIEQDFTWEQHARHFEIVYTEIARLKQFA